MVKDSDLIIQAPRQGVSTSPHVGFGSSVNLDIDSIPGIAQLNNLMAKVSSTTVTNQPNWAVRHPITTTEVYVLDNAGVVYKSSDTGATWAVLAGSSSTNAHGNGLWIWKNYLFVARDALLDVCGDGTSTGILAANWTLGWKTIDSDVLWHPMLTSKNDSKLYGGAGRYIYSLDEVTGQTYTPSNAATYTWTQQALDLPTAYRIKCIEELGNSLMSGTWQGTNIYDIRIADIFPWDRSSSSFGQPIVIDDFGVHAMKNDGNSLVVLAGISGTLYGSDGVTSYINGQLPIDLSGGKYLEWYPGSICRYKNKIFFGVGNGGSTAIAGQGVYSLKKTGRGNIINLEHQNSLLTDGSASSVKISALVPIARDKILVGWRSNTTYGLDLTTNTSYAYTTDYSGYFESPIYVVGSINNKTSYTELEVLFGRKLATGEGVQFSYRNSTSDSYTVIKDSNGNTLTLTFANLGAVLSHIIKADVPASETLQIKVALLGTSTTTPQFKTLYLRK
jgi:hypothetical protein